METIQNFVFYHADRSNSLKEGQNIELDEYNLSRFGRSYWHKFEKTSIEDMNNAEKREYYLEAIRREEKYSLYASRLQSIFAANTIEEAIIFATSIIPKPNNPIPIIEIFADRFWSLDSNWLDFEVEFDQQISNFRRYWDAQITNNRPIYGNRVPPRIEVMIELPAVTGKIVHVVN